MTYIIQRKPDKISYLHDKAYVKTVKEKEILFLPQQAMYKSVAIRTKKYGEIRLYLPDPISLALNHAKIQIEKITKLAKKINVDKRNVKYTDDPNKNIYKYIDPILLDDFVLTAISVPIMLCVALESFANTKIDEEKIHIEMPGIREKIKLNNQQGKYYDSYGMQRWVSTQDKIIKVLPVILYKEDIKTQPFYGSLIELIKIRDEIIHQKSISDKEKEETDSNLIIKLLDLNYTNLLNETKKILKYFDAKFHQLK